MSKLLGYVYVKRKGPLVAKIVAQMARRSICDIILIQKIESNVLGQTWLNSLSFNLIFFAHQPLRTEYPRNALYHDCRQCTISAFLRLLHIERVGTFRYVQ